MAEENPNPRNMKMITLALLFLGLSSLKAQTVQKLYPEREQRSRSSGHKSYYIDPNQGDDHNTGTSPGSPWKSFKKANQYIFTKGDRIEVVAPGSFYNSLVLIAEGTAAAPVTVNFAPGRYNFYPEAAIQEVLHISNTNNTPYVPKAIALYFSESKYVNVKANGALMVMRGKMIETYINKSENIKVEGISFDYERPTVSEMKVLNVTDHFADLSVHADSKYSIKDSLLIWQGEGWHYTPDNYWQIFNPATGDLARNNFPIKQVKFAEAGEKKIRAYFTTNPGYKTGLVLQNRDVTRDCAGVFMQRSKNISWKNVRFYFIHGMGVVSQFCENLKFDGVQVKPSDQSGRTCAAWADILHFASCRGQIEVLNSYLSAANDDAINIHGVHLRIVENPGPNQIKVRFMHHETYGFEAFIPGDSLEFIRAATLLPFGKNVVTAIQKIDDKNYLLSLKEAVPSGIKPEDVVENISWTPAVSIRHNVISRIPTRGILVTTRGKVVIEDNQFINTNMNSVLVSDDAESWYESGRVLDLTIQRNTFTKCGAPIINIHPENKEQGATAVHRNIKIQQNSFETDRFPVVSAKSTAGLLVTDNKIITNTEVAESALVQSKDCTAVKISRNKISSVK